MGYILELSVDELAATRFAVSPLAETVAGLQLLGYAPRHPPLRPWLRWARAEVRRTRLELPLTWPLLVTRRPAWPQFLLPSPATPEPDVGAELTHMRQTRADQVRRSLDRVFGDDRPPAAVQLAATPARTLRVIADELRAAHDVLVAPHWPQLRTVLHADIAYRARHLAIGGAERLFADLHRGVRWEAGRIFIAESGEDRRVRLGDGGLVLVPSVLVPDRVRVKGTTTTQTTLRYPARGAATVWERGLREPTRTLVALVGRPRARLLEAARRPVTTSDLAADLGVTPSAVSQHLRVLRGAGLVASDRAGRTKLHHLTDLGQSVLDA